MSGEGPVPLAILGGSDLRPGELPAGSEAHPLAAYKGAALEVGGRPIVLSVVDGFRACGAFAPIWIVGPASVYAHLVSDVEVVDTDADLKTNLQVLVDTFEERFDEGPLAVVTCDVLPSREDVERLVADYRRRPSALWFPLLRSPRDPRELGAFSWKPVYSVRPEPGARAVSVLPAHLLVADPRALRLELIYRLMQAAYDTRNRDVGSRRSAMLRAALAGLLYQDLLHLLALRLPNLTWSVVVHGLSLARELRSGELTRASLEEHVGRIVLKARHRREHPDLGVRLPILDALTLAEDVDTEEEARALGARLRARDS